MNCAACNSKRCGPRISFNPTSAKSLRHSGLLGLGGQAFFINLRGHHVTLMTEIKQLASHICVNSVAAAVQLCNVVNVIFRVFLFN